MKIAFISETNYQGKWPKDFLNARTEVAWQIALDADHHPIGAWQQVTGYDHVFIIFPKGKTFLNAEGSKISAVNEINPVSDLLASTFLADLKATNRRVYYIQEGPHWWYTNYEVAEQIHFYNLLNSVDQIFVHNWSDVSYYSGLAAGTPVSVMPALMIEDLIKEVEWKPSDEAIIGGNFSRWYGGFESFIVAQDFKVPIFAQTSHSTREGEDQLVQLIGRLPWVNWMQTLSTFKYAVHLMPTVAAGTFALNCAYFGIPCIGNIDVDTQSDCHHRLSVKVSDIAGARSLAIKLRKDQEFYELCSREAKQLYRELYDVSKWKEKMLFILEHETSKDIR